MSSWEVCVPEGRDKHLKVRANKKVCVFKYICGIVDTIVNADSECPPPFRITCPVPTHLKCSTHPPAERTPSTLLKKWKPQLVPFLLSASCMCKMEIGSYLLDMHCLKISHGNNVSHLGFLLQTRLLFLKLICGKSSNKASSLSFLKNSAFLSIWYHFLTVPRLF